MMKCSEQYLENLTAKDKEAIQSILGRNPNPSELLLLACFNRERVKNRVYHETLDRLDVQAKREIPDEFIIKDNLTINISTHSINKDITTDNMITDEPDDALFEEIIMNQGRRSYRLKTNKRPKVRWLVNNLNKTGKGYRTIYKKDTLPESGPNVNDRWAIIPNKEPTERSRLAKLGINIHSIQLNDMCMDSFLCFVKKTELGISVEQSLIHNLAEIAEPTVLLWYDGLHQANSQINSLNPLLTGTFQDHREIHCEADHIQIPVQALDFTSKSFTHGASIPNPELTSDWSIEDLDKHYDWNQTLIRMVTIVKGARPTIQTVQSRSYQNIGLLRLDDEYIWVSAIPDNEYFITIDPRAGGQLVVANAVRQLSCVGLKARYIDINFWLPALSEDTTWQGLQLLEATDSALRILGLQMIARTVNTTETGLDLQCAVHTVAERKQEFMGWGYQNDGDFISLLGSHRGELGGSLFLREIYGKYGGPVPAVDLTMETRIQDVVLQGIQSGLIRSANPVGAGGLACTAVRSLLN
ncbi:MAG: hypothetical protein GXO90_07930, partial [FCB group bacterium]|nr:hypothetical protein [FCB group bacterium]